MRRQSQPLEPLHYFLADGTAADYAHGPAAQLVLVMAPGPTVPLALLTRLSIWERRRMQASISAMVNSAVVVAFSPRELHTGIPFEFA